MHETVIRVRFDEVDTMHVVHHPRYLVYFEIARTEYFRALGIRYRDVMAGGTHLPIVDLACRYVRPARYDDEVVVETRCTAVGGATVTLSYAVRRGAELLVTGFTRLGAVDGEGRAKRLPADVRAAFETVVERDPHAPDTKDSGASRVQSRA